MSDMAMSSPDRAWAVLDEPAGENLASFPLDVWFEGDACRLALDHSGSRHLLIPCVNEHPVLDGRPAVLSAVIRPLTFGCATATYLDISCLDKDLHPEFDEVIVDVVETVRHSDRPATAGAEALGRWRRLFRSRHIRGLSMEAKIGLYAELTVLSALFDVDGDFSVHSWRGPLREPHDFELESRCIEVKGVAENSEGFTVHGWDQLDTHDGRSLDLALITVVHDPDGTSISDLVAALRSRTHSSATFTGRLLAAGWDEQTQTEDTDSFAVGPVYGVPITGDVPRLVRSALLDGKPPDGILDLRYYVGLASLLPHATGASLDVIAEEALR